MSMAKRPGRQHWHARLVLRVTAIVPHVIIATTLLCAARAESQGPADDVDAVLRRLEQERSSLASFFHEYEHLSTSFGGKEGLQSIRRWEERKEGNINRRMEIKVGAPSPDKGTDKEAISSLNVSDGTTTWTVTTLGGETTVMRSSASDPGAPMEDLAAVRQMIQNGKARVRPSETISGSRCAVIEVVGNADGRRYKFTAWIAEESGLVLQQWISHSDGRRQERFTRKVEINKPINPALFQYAPPEGATVHGTDSPPVR